MSSLSYYKDLIFVLTAKEIKVKYKNNFFGYICSILHPLSMAMVFYFAFKFVMKIPLKNFTLFLISGLFPWQWFSNSVGASSTILIGNASLIKKVNFPRHFIPLAIVLNDLFHFVMSLPVIFGFEFFYKVSPTLAWSYGIPLLILTQFLITFGFSLIVSSINLFFRDMERIVLIGLNILFYLTPIVYDISLVPERFKTFFFLNPLYPVIEEWHGIFLKGFIDWRLYCISLFQATAIFLLGFLIFKKLSWKFAEVL